MANQKSRAEAPFFAHAMMALGLANEAVATRARYPSTHLSAAKKGRRSLPLEVRRALCRQMSTKLHLLDVMMPMDRLEALAQDIWEERQAAKEAASSAENAGS